MRDDWESLVHRNWFGYLWDPYVLELTGESESHTPTVRRNSRRNVFFFDVLFCNHRLGSCLTDNQFLVLRLKLDSLRSRAQELIPYNVIKKTKLRLKLS